MVLVETTFPEPLGVKTLWVWKILQTDRERPWDLREGLRDRRLLPAPHVAHAEVFGLAKGEFGSGESADAAVASAVHKEPAGEFAARARLCIEGGYRGYAFAGIRHLDGEDVVIQEE